MKSAGYCHVCGAALGSKGMAEDLERFFDYALDLFCIAGTDGYFKRVNRAFERTLGHTADELLARPFVDFIHPDDITDTHAEVGKLASGAPTLAFHNRYRCKDGTYRDLHWTTYPDDETGQLYAVARDVTDIRRAEQLVDYTTGAASARALTETLPVEWRRAARSGRPLAAAMFDLDHLRDYNFRFGHSAGDKCLRKVAEVLQGRIRRAGDLVARGNGAAFVVLMQGGLSATEASALCENVREAVASLKVPHPGSTEGIVTVSVGVVTLVPDKDASDETTLLDQARAALALAKKEGRNRVLLAPGSA